MRIPAVKLYIIAATLTAAACRQPSPEEERIKEAQSYLAYRGEVAPELRRAVLSGKVVLGMAPDEARAAAGACVLSISPIDPKWPQGTNPMTIAAAQRLHPDSSQIMMRFWTTTQFNTPEPWGFNVEFERGRAVRILRDPLAATSPP